MTYAASNVKQNEVLIQVTIFYIVNYAFVSHNYYKLSEKFNTEVRNFQPSKTAAANFLNLMNN